MGAGVVCWGQAATEVNRAEAYYQYTLAHLYSNLAAEAINGGEYVNDAITAYKAAIAADPRVGLFADELSILYVRYNRMAQGRSEAEEAIRKNPNDVTAHRILARIFAQLLVSGPNQSVDPVMLKRATEEYQKITELDPNDIDAWVFLGRLQHASQDASGAARSFEKALALDDKNEDALMGRAQLYAEAGETQRATEMLERAAQADPSAALWTQVAGNYEELREWELAAEAIRKALTLNPEDPKTLRRALAQDLLNANRFEEALEAYDSAAEEDPKDVQLWLRIAQLNLQVGNLPKAREAVDKANALSANNPDVRFTEASLLQAEGKPRDAISRLVSLLEQTARVAYSTQQKNVRIEVLNRLAGLYRLTSQPDEAVSAYRQIVELNRALEPDVAADIIDTYREGRRMDDAEREAKAALVKFPDHRAVRMAKAWVDADMGRATAAANDVRKLLGGTDDRSVQMVLAQIYEKGKLFDDASKALDAAEKLSTTPNDQLAIWFMRGALYEKMNNLPLAEGEFRKVLSVSPDHAGALNYLGYMLTDRNVRLNEALSMIQKALSRDPNNGAYLDSLGWVYFRMGRFQEAEEQIRRAVDLVPGDPTMFDHFGDALMQQRKVKEAVAAWEEALREWQASSPADKDQAEMDKVRNKLDRARQQLR
jgi:tetratricopeptide (TPR) repeat protein